MPARDTRLRPETETFEHAGWRVTVVDAGYALAAADGRRVELLRPGAFGGPVREASLSVTVDSDRYLLDALLRTGPAGADREGRVTVAALGNDPLSQLLSKRVAAGDKWASSIVDGMGAVATQMSKLFPPADAPAQTAPSAPSAPGPAPAPAGTADDHVTRTQAERTAGDVTATVTVHVPAEEDGERTVTLRAAVPTADMSASRLADMARLLLDVATEAGVPAGEVTLSAIVDTDTHATLDQVGGLDGIVNQLRQIAVSFRHPDAMARWGARRPQGLLLYGPPGTGKTMLARALAHEIGARFEEIHTPDILDKWLGASERNIKRIFTDAHRYREPTVMLFDEFDSIIGYAGEGSDSGSQTINAVAGIFKQEMNDLFEANPRVIVVATTNFPDRVDASLTRSGRFDIKLLVPAPDAAGRAEILAKMIRRLITGYEVNGFRMFADDVDVDALGEASEAMTGADLGEVLRRAQLAKAMQEARTGEPADPVSQADLLHHIADLRAESRR